MACILSLKLSSEAVDVLSGFIEPTWIKTEHEARVVALVEPKPSGCERRVLDVITLGEDPKTGTTPLVDDVWPNGSGC